ncbi:unnamed protein product [Symbiodinium sp. KB8]|nr:unnamed protein product [Symbiodinium sp. KB8]
MKLFSLAVAAFALVACAGFAAARLGGISDDDMAPVCDNLGSKSECFAKDCEWCVAGAVPSRCLTHKQAKLVPPGVFECSSSVEAEEPAAPAIPDFGFVDSPCLDLANATACHADSCAWCKAGAVPSRCLPWDMAKKLPPGVFECS